MTTAERFARELRTLTNEQIYALVVLTRSTLSRPEMEAIRVNLASRLSSSNADMELQAAYDKLAEDKPTETSAPVTVLIGSTQFGCWFGKGQQHGTGTIPTVESPDRKSPNGEAWTEQKNARRRKLIDKKIQRTISPDERAELDQLQAEAVAYRDKVAPLPIEAARRVHQELLHQQQREVPE